MTVALREGTFTGTNVFNVAAGEGVTPTEQTLVQRIMYWDRRMSNAFLQSITA